MPDKTEDTKIRKSEFNLFLSQYASDIEELRDELREIRREYGSDFQAASRAGRILSKEFVQRRAEEVGSDAYQLAKKAYLKSEESNAAFELVLDETFKLSEVFRDVERMSYDLWEWRHRIRKVEERYCELKVDIIDETKEHAEGVINSLIGFAGTGSVTTAEIIKEKGPMLKRLAKLEQKMTALKPDQQKLRDDGDFVESVHKLGEIVQTVKAMMLLNGERLDRLEKPKWWQFWKRR